MREEIRDLQQNLKLTSVYVTHDQEEALAVSDKIIVMNRGRIAQEGAPADLYQRPADAFVADFIGGANLIPCSIIARHGTRATVRFADQELAIEANAPGSGDAFLVVRSSSVSLRAAGSGAQGPALPASVRKATYLGSHWEYTLDTAVGELWIAQPVSRRFSPGCAVDLLFDVEHLSLVARPAAGN
jgi:iron(III) transport system ATP-binding protein